MQKTKEQNYKSFYNTIKALNCSQGSYGKLLRMLDNLDELDKQELIDNLPDFKGTVDIILFIEQVYR